MSRHVVATTDEIPPGQRKVVPVGGQFNFLVNPPFDWRLFGIQLEAHRNLVEDQRGWNAIIDGKLVKRLVSLEIAHKERAPEDA